MRGSTGYGKTFVKLDNGCKREDSVKDIGALLDWIAAQPDLDALAGHGHRRQLRRLHDAGRRDALRRPDPLRRSTSSASPTSSPSSSTPRATGATCAASSTATSATRRCAPSSSGSRRSTTRTKITKPLFVVQGANDPRVPRTEAEQMVATVKRNGTPVWYLLAKDEGHGFRKKANADFQFYATVQFIRTYLLGDDGMRP